MIDDVGLYEMPKKFKDYPDLKYDVRIQLQFENEVLNELIQLKTKTLPKDVFVNQSIMLIDKNNSGKVKKVERIIKHYDAETYVSKTTPIMEITFDETVNFVKLVNKICKLKFVDAISITKVPQIYNYDIFCPFSGMCSEGPPATNLPTNQVSNVRCTSQTCDNFPTNIMYTGENIKLGMIDNGLLKTSYSNLYPYRNNILIADEVVHTVIEHPYKVASIMVGSEGIAENAKLYYRELENHSSYIRETDYYFTNYELQPNDLVDVINISNGILLFSERDNAYFNFVIDYYDVPVVFAAGNSLEGSDTEALIKSPNSTMNGLTVGSIDDDGYPSFFSSYQNYSDFSSSKPDISAVGEGREIPNFPDYSTQYGTSFSAPAVAATIGLLLEKLRTEESGTYDDSLKVDPKILYSILSATSNDEKINESAQQIYTFTGGTKTIPANTMDQNTGLHPRTGAGALDIEKVMNFDSEYQLVTTYDSTYGTFREVDCIYDILENKIMESVFLSTGEHITFSTFFSRDAFSTGELLANLDYEYQNDIMPQVRIRVYTDNLAQIYQDYYLYNSSHYRIEFTAPNSDFYYFVVENLTPEANNLEFGYAFVVE